MATFMDFLRSVYGDGFSRIDDPRLGGIGLDPLPRRAVPMPLAGFPGSPPPLTAMPRGPMTRIDDPRMTRNPMTRIDDPVIRRDPINRITDPVLTRNPINRITDPVIQRTTPIPKNSIGLPDVKPVGNTINGRPFQSRGPVQGR